MPGIYYSRPGSLSLPSGPRALYQTGAPGLQSGIVFTALCLLNTNIHCIWEVFFMKCTHPHVLLGCPCQRSRSAPVTVVGTRATEHGLVSLTPRFLPQLILPSLPGFLLNTVSIPLPPLSEIFTSSPFPC